MGSCWPLFESGTKNSFFRERFAEGFRCPDTGKIFPEPRASLFTFNSAIGACSVCSGFGRVLSIDRELCVPDIRKSIEQGAIACWEGDARGAERRKLFGFCDDFGIDVGKPWRKLSKRQQNAIFEGPSEAHSYKGIIPWFKRLERKRHKMHVRVFLSRYRSEKYLSILLRKLVSSLMLYCIPSKIKTLPEMWESPVGEVLPFFQALAEKHGENTVAETALEEVIARLTYLSSIGLDYLTLDRQSRTLSGGESQRVNLTSILGARLVNTTLVLDEPTIGLHSRDTKRLIKTLQVLKERGNTVIVVEHDGEMIKAADEVVDLGPQAGARGGEIVFSRQCSRPTCVKRFYYCCLLGGE